MKEKCGLPFEMLLAVEFTTLRVMYNIFEVKRIDAIGDRVAYGLCNSFTRICNAGAPAVTCSKSSPHTDRYRCRFYWFYEHPSTNFVTGILLICDWLDRAVSVTGYLRSLSNPCELLLWIRLFKGPQHFVPSDESSSRFSTSLSFSSLFQQEEVKAEETKQEPAGESPAETAEVTTPTEGTPASPNAVTSPDNKETKKKEKVRSIVLEYVIIRDGIRKTKLHLLHGKVYTQRKTSFEESDGLTR